MESDEAPDQNHRRNIQQFIPKGPTQRAEQELDHIGRHSDRIGTPDAISRQERYLEQLLKKIGHLLDEYTGVGYTKTRKLNGCLAEALHNESQHRRLMK
jgi:hypothetical protein